MSLWGPTLVTVKYLVDSSRYRFHAASHAVAALDDHLSSRAVVARMKVVPETARSLHGELFGDYFRRSLKSEEHISGKQFFTPLNQRLKWM